MAPGPIELRWRWLALIAFYSLTLGSLLGLALYRDKLTRVAPTEVTTIGDALVGGHFSLIDLNGRRVTDADFRNRPLIVTFGYTSDPDQTPAVLQVVGRIIEALGVNEARANFVLITLDPEDTPERLTEYLQHFNKRIQGLTGSAIDIAAAAKSYRIPVVRGVEATPKDSRSISFDAMIFLLNSQGIYVSHATLDDDVGPFIHRLKQVL
jgi:protein SCO1/2